MKNNLIMATILFSLTACGGGGGASAGGGEVSKTSEIISTEEFEFKTSWEMNVDISISQSQGTNDMLSICNKYTDNGNGTYNIDYSSCALRATLDDQGNYTSTMNITNDVESLVGVVWFKDKSPPLYQEFTITNGQADLVWN